MNNYQIASGSTGLEFVGCKKVILTFMKLQTVCLGIQSKNAWNSFKIIRTCAESLSIIIMMNRIVGSNTHRKLEIVE